MDYWHKAWTCPFFKWDDKQCVACEGGKLHFPDKESATEYMDAFCAGKDRAWEWCSIAASLLQYYERKEKSDHE